MNYLTVFWQTLHGEARLLAHYARNPRATLRQVWAFLPQLPQWLLASPSATEAAQLPQRLLAWVLLSRVIFAGLGVWMATNHMFSLMQAFPLEWYGTGFWGRIWVLHSQPPLFMLLTWLVVKLAPFGLYAAIIWPLFVGMGLLMTYALYQTARFFKVPARLAALGVLGFMLSSNTILYETYYLYSYPIAVLLAVALWQFTQYLQHPKAHHALGVGVCLGLPCLLHSLVHLIYVVPLLLVGVLGVKRPLLWLGMVLVGLLPPLGWYGKNYIMYGNFGASSWFGITVANITSHYPLRPTERATVVAAGLAEGTLTPLAVQVGQVHTFRGIAAYPASVQAALQSPPTGYDVLDAPIRPDGLVNYHSMAQRTLGQLYLQNAKAVWHHAPQAYGRGVQAAAYLFLLAPSEWFHTRSKTLIFYYDWAWQFATTGKLFWQPRSHSQLLRVKPGFTGGMPNTLWGYGAFNGWGNFPFISLLLLPALLSYGAWRALAGLATAWRHAAQRPQVVALWFLMGIVGYIALASLLLDIGENQRYRYYQSPLLALVFLQALHQGLHQWLGRWQRKKTLAA